MTQLHRFFYYSRATEKAHMRGVTNIVQVGNDFTRKNAISGLLVLDGEYFYEYLEGPAPAMQFLIARLRTDPRHADMVVLLDSALLNDERRFTVWNMAFAVGQAQSVQSLIGADGETALAHFMSMVPELEIVQ